MKLLCLVSPQIRVLLWFGKIGKNYHTSVSMAKSGFHEAGGMILQIPNWEASGVIFFIYSSGSRHSSSVGQ